MNGHSLKLIPLLVEAGEAWSIPLDGLLFLLPQGGEVLCACGPLTEPIVPGDVVVFGNATGATLSVSKGKRFQAGWFSVCLEDLYPLLGCAEILQLHNFAERFRGLRRFHHGSYEAKECHRVLGKVPAESNLDHRSRLLRVVAMALSSELGRAQEQQGSMVPGDAHFSKVVQSLSIDNLQRMGVDDLAAQFGCSRRHLNRLFHKHFGISVADLRREARLLKALCLLRRPGAKIMGIAEECGFNHLGLFNSSFKRRFGSSPGQLRKEWANAESDLGGGEQLPAKQGLAPNITIAKPLPGDKGTAVNVNGKPQSGSSNRNGKGGSSENSNRSRRVAQEWLDLKSKELLASIKPATPASPLRASHS